MESLELFSCQFVHLLLHILHKHGSLQVALHYLIKMHKIINKHRICHLSVRFFCGTFWLRMRNLYAVTKYGFCKAWFRYIVLGNNPKSLHEFAVSNEHESNILLIDNIPSFLWCFANTACSWLLRSIPMQITISNIDDIKICWENSRCIISNSYDQW